MAISNISGSADANLVSAATKAAKANVPKDLSGVHERISGAYAKEAKARGEMWGKAIKVVSDIGADLIKSAKQDSKPEWNNDAIKDFDSKYTSGVNPDNTSGMVKARNPKTGEIEDVPAEQRFTYFDNNGNEKAIKPMTTEDTLRDIRTQLTDLAWWKKNAINEGTGQPWTNEEKKKEKQRLKNKRDNIRQSNVDFGAFQETMKTKLAEDNINTSASGMYNAEGMLFAQAMLANGDPVAQKDPNLAQYDGGRAVQGYDDEGNMIFTYVNKDGVPFKNKDGQNMTIGKGDLDSLFIPKSPKREVMDVLIDPKLIRNNYEYGFGNFENEINRSVDSQITDKNTFLDIAFYHSSNTKGSLADSLNGIEYGEGGFTSAKETPMFTMFMDALDGISAEERNELDTGTDGKLTEDDWNTQENLDKLIKNALSGENIELGKSLLKEFYKLEAKTHYDDAVTANADNSIDNIGG